MVLHQQLLLEVAVLQLLVLPDPCASLGVGSVLHGRMIFPREVTFGKCLLNGSWRMYRGILAGGVLVEQISEQQLAARTRATPYLRIAGWYLCRRDALVCTL